MNQRAKRWLALLMTLAMCLSLLPAAALADWAKACESGGAEYDTVQEAINAAADGCDTTVRLISDRQENLIVPAGKSIVLDLNGHVLQGVDSGAVIVSRGKLTITDSEPDAAHYFAYIQGGHWTLDPTAKEGISVSDITEATLYETKVKVTGGVIMGGHGGYSGGGIYNEGGKLNMQAGSIVGNEAINGGGIYNDGGTVTLAENVSVIGNYSENKGAGICVMQSGALTMNGSTVFSNTAGGTNGNGGGVFVEGTFIMNGGLIGGNKTGNDGGGVYVSDSGTLTMNSGAIRGNTAINSGGGVYYGADNGCISGAVQITENIVQGEANNLYLAQGKYPILDSQHPLNGALIGVTTQVQPESSDGISVAASPARDDEAHFLSDADGYYVRAGSSVGCLILVPADPWTEAEDAVLPAPDGDVYTVKTAGQLAAVAKQVNAGTMDFSGKTVKLDSDIDLSAHKWVPIGTSGTVSNMYKGTFDGAGHKITGMYVTGYYNYAGLFGCVQGTSDNPAEIKNVSVEGSVTAAASSTDCCVGGLAGYFCGGSILNCSSACSVIGSANSDKIATVGGLVGLNVDGSIKNCYAACNVTQAANGNSCTAGLVASNTGNASVINCYAAGVVSITGLPSHACVGGLVGSNCNGGTVTNCCYLKNGNTAYYGIGTNDSGKVTSDDDSACTPMDGNQMKGTAADSTAVFLNRGTAQYCSGEDWYNWGVKDDENSGWPVFHLHTWTYTAEDASLTAVCGNGDGRHCGECSVVLTLSAPDSLIWDGTEKPAVISEAGIIAWTDTGLKVPEVLYQTKTGDDFGEKSSDAPNDVGAYKAVITAGDVSAHVEYTISPRPSGGGGDATWVVTVPLIDGDTSVDVRTYVSGNTATVQSIDTADLNKVIGNDAYTGTVTVDLTGLNKTIDTVKLPTDAVKEIAAAAADKETDGLTVKLTTGTVTFDADALAAIAEQAGGQDLTLKVDTAGAQTLSNEQRTVIDDMETSIVLDIYMISGGQRISDFTGGSAVISLPFQIPEGKTAADFAVYYLAGDGTLTDMKAVYENGCFVFTVTHFSHYVIAPAGLTGLPGGYTDCPKDGTCPMDPFTDAPNDAWYHDGVHYCLEKCIMYGVGNNSFNPNGEITRAMIVTMLYRLDGSPMVNGVCPFDDVTADDWFSYAVLWANLNGIVHGISDTVFAPNDAITREQLAAMLYRYVRYKGIDTESVGADTNTLSYDDITEISEWAGPAVHWAIAAGLIIGTTEATIEPLSTSTRAQAATVFMRLCEKVLTAQTGD